MGKAPENHCNAVASACSKHWFEKRETDEYDLTETTYYPCFSHGAKGCSNEPPELGYSWPEDRVCPLAWGLAETYRPRFTLMVHGQYPVQSDEDGHDVPGSALTGTELLRLHLTNFHAIGMAPAVESGPLQSFLETKYETLESAAAELNINKETLESLGSPASPGWLTKLKAATKKARHVVFSNLGATAASLTELHEQDHQLKLKSREAWTSLLEASVDVSADGSIAQTSLRAALRGLYSAAKDAWDAELEGEAKDRAKQLAKFEWDQLTASAGYEVV